MAHFTDEETEAEDVNKLPATEVMLIDRSGR